MTILGVDVSYYQPPPLPWSAWRAFGVQRAHIRASIGYLMDWAYPQHREQARAAGIQTGVYHALLDHDDEIAQFDPAQAARNFVNLMQPDDELPAAVDVEALGIDDGLLAAWIGEYQRLTDWPLMIYSSQYFWNRLIGPGRTRYSRFPFWVAQYSKPLTLIPDVAAIVAGHQFRYKAGYLPAWGKDLDLDEWYDSTADVPSAPEPAPPATPAPVVGAPFRLGAHVLGTSADARRLTEQARSPVIKLVGDFGAAADYAAMAHRPLVVGRYVVADELRPDYLAEHGFDPEDAADLYFDANYRQRVLDHPAVAAWEGPNEPVTKTPAAMAWYARFEARRVALLATLGRRAVIGNWSTGQPEPELWPHFAPALDAIRAQGGYLGLHEYSEPSRNYDTWYMGRFERAPRDVPKIITESGTDSIPPVPVQGHPAGKPWRQQFGGDVAAYAAFLQAYDARLRAAPDIVGAVIFTFGSGWPDHNVEGSGLADRLIAYARTLPAPLTIPGDDMIEYVVVTTDAVSAGRLRQLLGVDLVELRVAIPVAAIPDPPAAPSWWETKSPPYKLKATGRTITIYKADGVTPATAPRVQSGEWDVFARQGGLLKVLDPAGDAGDWWVKAADVEPK